MRKEVVCCFGAAIMAVYLAACHRSEAKAHESENAESPLPAASVVPVVRGPLASELHVAGQFIPYQEVDLHAKVAGYIRSIRVDIGDRVRAGQTLAVLEVPELQAQVVGAAAQVRHTQSEIGRADSEVARAESTHQALHAAYNRLTKAAAERPGLIAQQELDDARAKDENSEAQVRVAKASREAAQEQLGVSEADRLRVQTMSNYATVAAPFNGVIVRRYADTGALIQAGTNSSTQAMPVVRIAQTDVLRLRMPVPESDVAYIRPGSNVEVTVGALRRKWNASITRFTRSLDPSTRTMIAEVDVPNHDGVLNPGMYAETTVMLQQRQRALQVPAQAVLRDGPSPYVMAVNRDGTVRKCEVQAGIEGNNRVEITRGLNEDESVIVSGQNSYRDGQKVRPQNVANGSEKEEDQ